MQPGGGEQVLVLFTYLELFLLMWLLDMRINAPTVTCTILAAGFAVDYCLHIATATVGAEGGGTWGERAARALEGMGAAVLNGGVTTLLASCGLILGSSGIMQSMFRMMMGIVAFGMAQGLWLQPVVFNLFDFLGFLSLFLGFLQHLLHPNHFR